MCGKANSVFAQSFGMVWYGFKAVSAERGQHSRLWPPVRFEPRTHRLRGWTIDFPSQVPRRLPKVLAAPNVGEYINIIAFCNIKSDT